MAESLSTPRISSTYLDSFTNRTVRITGKVIQLRGEEATLDSNGHITAHLNRVLPLSAFCLGSSLTPPRTRISQSAMPSRLSGR